MVVISEKNITLPRLAVLVKSILSKTSRTKKLVNTIAKIIHYKDVLFYTWKTLRRILSREKEGGDIFMLNALELLEQISISKLLHDGGESFEVMGLQKDCKKFALDITLLKKHVRKVWQFLINKDMSPIVHKKLMFVLLELYLSKLDNPIFLTDFFMASLNMKGVVRILALQGVATLMQRHNVEYPNIYAKLYSLFEPTIFHTKYKSRLFYLANIFLSSTHLPEALVASFAKRASRLSLTCPAPDLVAIFRFVGNMLLRHTGLVRMIQRVDPLEVPEDPFVEQEGDPMRSRASESSLWELSLLCNHCQPSVSSAARFIQSKLPSVEFDLSEALENSYEEMFESECKKTRKVKPSVTFERPHETVARLKDDRVFKLWSLTSWSACHMRTMTCCGATKPKSGFRDRHAWNVPAYAQVVCYNSFPTNIKCDRAAKGKR